MILMTRSRIGRRRSRPLLRLATVALTAVVAAGAARPQTPGGVAPAPSPQSDGLRILELKVGDGRVKGTDFRPYTNEWRVEVRDSRGTLLGLAATWTDELQIVRVDSTECLQRTQRAVFSKDGTVVGTTETVNVFDRVTLAPRSRRFVKHAAAPGQEEETSVAFAGRSVHWTRTVNGKREDEQAELPEPVFDFYGGLYGLLFAALPLERGLSAQLPALAEDEPRPTSVEMNVTGEAEVDAGHLGKRHVWIVERHRPWADEAMDLQAGALHPPPGVHRERQRIDLGLHRDRRGLE